MADGIIDVASAAMATTADTETHHVVLPWSHGGAPTPVSMMEMESIVQPVCCSRMDGCGYICYCNSH